MRAERGFTLLETVVALAITAIVLSAAWQAVRHAATASGQVTRQETELAAARSALLELAAELETARPDTVQVAAGRQLSLRRLEPEPLAVTWSLEQGRLVRRSVSPFAPAGAASDERVVLAALDDLYVRCLADGAWRDTWNGPEPPRAVDVVARTAGGESLATRVALPAARDH